MYVASIYLFLTVRPCSGMNFDCESVISFS